METLIKNKNAVTDNQKKIFERLAGKKVMNFISDQVDLTKRKTILVLPWDEITMYENNDKEQIRTIIDLQVINHKENLDEYFKYVNNALPDAGIFIGCVESHTERKQRLSLKHSQFIAKIIWFLDFVIHRVLSKLTLTKPVYNFFSKGKYKVLSKAEALGRLCYNGFEIIGHERINNLFYFSVIKTKLAPEGNKPHYGIVFKMNRIGINGKIIGVYKIRTMYAYSEFLQDYVVKLNGYNKAGKPSRDFRLTGWGTIIRALHLDELPQLLNVIKGDLNIVGVRPLSRFGFKSLPEDLQKERIKYKPGCIPPSVSLGITGFKEVIRAERLYLWQRKKKGPVTNVKYFGMAVYNLARRKTFSS
ncbi:MAG: sugar transferase [Bacteroidetes bacterium]|nr:sugar transferase [Bacteroidota bacterium]